MTACTLEQLTLFPSILQIYRVAKNIIAVAETVVASYTGRSLRLTHHHSFYPSCQPAHSCTPFISNDMQAITHKCGHTEREKIIKIFILLIQTT